MHWVCCLSEQAPLAAGPWAPAAGSAVVSCLLHPRFHWRAVCDYWGVVT